MPSVNRIDLQALTLAGPTVTRTVPDTLAVLSLNNRVYIKLAVQQKIVYDI